ncbi:PREDICTED: uncharacterized protein LOC104803340 [Tarenaya hassleriana]|uniref:uncharacterized protein LOC104803340 n=1 Tax=Tarenaya hassleriana TaxID=28532 RepID=UPI00053CA02F|nr:PREDICTED: uncharacterized protein LOC104803340 [Tarenaya hassleriana]
MASRFQDAPLVTAPSYPDAVAWSPENLIAVAAGHFVIILNPALPSGPRGLITIPNAEPYQIGVVRREDLLTGGLLPSCLKRDRQPCVRSLSWSDLGMSSNYGCLLAVCTAEGRVKLYRPPYSEFCAEWIEIVDVSNMLYEYLSSVSFGELDNPHTELSKEQVVEPEFEDDEQNLIVRASKKKRTSVDKSDLQDKSYTDQPSYSKQRKKKVLGSETNEQANNTQQFLSPCKAQKKCTVEISPLKYVSRDAVLSFLSVAWSPLLSFSSKTSSHGNLRRFSLLAIGSKSGDVSLWKVYSPECYNIDRSNVSPDVKHRGMLHAHSSWVSTLSWGIVGSDFSNPQVLLATGSSDGSVKIWTSNNNDLLESSENKCSFSLLKQVLSTNPVPISTLSLVVCNHSEAMHLAIGKGSGSFEVWICEISACKFKRIGSCDAHDQVITGLAWAFDGRCLYSCSQDNYVRNWILRGNTISEVPMPSNNPGLVSTTEISDEFLSCLGIALSPGNLAVALVRTFNIGLLDQMYQARSQKAVVEFLWNGAQLSGESEDSSGAMAEAHVDLSKNELACWECNFLWSLKKFEDSSKALVTWDVIAAMQAFKHSMPEFIELVVTEWLSVSYLGYQTDMSTGELLQEISKRFSAVPSRLLQILNVISRRVMLSELKTEEINGKVRERRTDDEEDIGLWLELLEKSERELRERLVGLSLSAYLMAESRPACDPHSMRLWHATGLAQLQRWVDMNHVHVHGELETLAAKVKSHLTRSRSTETEAEEKCPYCLAAVHFHSPEEAFCQSKLQNKNKSSSSSKNKSRNKDREGNEEKSDQRHKLERCSVSMQVCQPTPQWFCKCCHRFSSKLVPEALFTLPSFPTDHKSLRESSLFEVLAKPVCPFCGILMQRKQPEFLLSASPV